MSHVAAYNTPHYPYSPVLIGNYTFLYPPSRTRFACVDSTLGNRKLLASESVILVRSLVDRTGSSLVAISILSFKILGNVGLSGPKTLFLILRSINKDLFQSCQPPSQTLVRWNLTIMIPGRSWSIKPYPPPSGGLP